MALLYRAVYSTPNRDKIIGTNIPCGHDVYKFFIIIYFYYLSMVFFSCHVKPSIVVLF
jgi:hypothetical protein